MKSLIKYSHILKWVFFLLGVLLIATRFFYGKSNELNEKGELILTSYGVTLSILGVLFFVFGLLCRGIDNTDTKK